MGYFAIAEPKNGTDSGTCISEDCGHTDCAATRKFVAQPCPGCGEPLGYGKNLIGSDEGTVHLRCMDNQGNIIHKGASGE